MPTRGAAILGPWLCALWLQVKDPLGQMLPRLAAALREHLHGPSTLSCAAMEVGVLQCACVHAGLQHAHVPSGSRMVTCP